ncbi:SRPBCC family protein [Rhizobium oryzicola]|uniref:SRPBCC family protein n=1 Tax=Rhizobium oryzicola TaxID=1232668 RepID=A0ABT8T161_9HYPH|nr:SRPBCC family protein [Rhizobium oryzicola]MDO1584371.1 SRPBCC family protein [Rhizobium oryzicola]
MPTMGTIIVHVTIEKPWREVYAFAANPENMALWASGLGRGLVREDDHWLADGGPLGTIQVTFAPANDFGVIDHIVSMPSGLNVHNAFRIVPNGDGAEAIFMVTRLPDMSEEQFSQDAAHVLSDLTSLKRILEDGEGA